MSLHDRIATPDGKGRYVRALFATIADRYDFITVALSWGQDQRWKRRLVRLASPHAGVRAPGLAGGTGARVPSGRHPDAPISGSVVRSRDRRLRLTERPRP